MADLLFSQVLQFNQNQLFAPNRRGGQTSSSGKTKTTTTCAVSATPPGETTLPILETKVEPCGRKGLFGECFQLIKTQAVCPPGRFLKDGLCHTTPGSGGSGGAGTPAIPLPAPSPLPFLKGVLVKEKEEIERLMKLAAKIGPVAQTVKDEENAYDAAFEAETPTPIPAYTDTLQGFTFVMFFFSYAALAIVMTVFINMTTGNPVSAGGTLIGFIVFGAVIFALLKRFA